jgi:capsular polysaccharide transport system permease protein
LSVIPHSKALKAQDLERLSKLKVKRNSLISWCWFGIAVVIPVLVSAVYYGFLASPQYAAEFKFTVTDVSPSIMNGGANPLLSVLGGTSPAGSNNNFVVVDYLSSRQAVEELQRRIRIKELYSRQNIDWFDRFDSTRPIEDFVKYWQAHITAHFDMVTGIASAEVRAYSPDDALAISNTLVSLAEELINRIANRTRLDAVRLARTELEDAQDKLRQARDKMTAYRVKFGLIDPSTSVVASNSTLIQSLRANLVQLETQLSTLLAQKLNSDAPAVVALKNQIKSTQEQLSRTEESVGNPTKQAPLSTVVSDYERLNLEVQLSQNLVTSAMQAFEQARATASAQQLYITPYVRPSRPESATYPLRLLSILFVAFVGCAIWIVGILIGRSTFERFA